MTSTRSRIVLGCVLAVGGLGAVTCVARRALVVPAPNTAQRAADSLARAAPALAAVVPPAPTDGFVVDKTGHLDSATRDSLTREIAQVRRETQGDIAIAVVPSIAENAPVEVAGAIFRTWRVGRWVPMRGARVSLGVVVLIVPRETASDHVGRCFIATGTGMDSILPDSAAAAMCRTVIVPHLKLLEYSLAMHAAVQGIGERYRAATGKDVALVSRRRVARR